MAVIYDWAPVVGTPLNDTLLVDFATVDAMHYTQHLPGTDIVHSWNREVVAGGGNDIIRRDRPGDYKADPVVGAVHTEGYVGISGGAGSDTVDYSLFNGSMEIDLRPVGEAIANTYAYQVNQKFDVENSGFAKATDANGTTIYGHDFLQSIENVIATNGDDTVTGTDGANTIEGLGGKDKIHGLDGDDRLDGGDQNDQVHGGDGSDIILGGGGHDNLWGGDDNDIVSGGDGHDHIDGGEGNDVLGGGDGKDDIKGEAGADIIYGNDDNDTISGGDDRDVISGGHGNDMLFGDGGGDAIRGGDGNDNIEGGDGADSVYGEDGDDRLVVHTFDAVGTWDLFVDGGNGFDTLAQKGDHSVRVYLSTSGNGYMENIVGDGMSNLLSIEAVRTSGGDDILMFGSNANKAWGMDGDDAISLGGGADEGWGGDGNDTMNGGPGDDYLDGGDGGDVMQGGFGDDDVRGRAGNDALLGGEGNDAIRGGGGDDVIRGGEGDDHLFGGFGADKFVWKDGDTGVDILKDFELGTDKLDIDDILAIPPGHHNPSYFGKVLALPTAWDDTTALYALTDDGWSAFAQIEGYDAETIVDAIQSGVLFGIEPGGGVGGFDQVFDLPSKGSGTSFDFFL